MYFLGFFTYNSLEIDPDCAHTNNVILLLNFIVKYSLKWIYPICLTIHPLKYIQVVSSFWLLQIKLLQAFIYRFLCEHKSSLLWDKFPGMFYSLAVPFYSPTQNAWVIWFLFILTSILVLVFILTILIGI